MEEDRLKEVVQELNQWLKDHKVILKVDSSVRVVPLEEAQTDKLETKE